MIWTTGGVPMQGLTGGGGGDRRVEYILPQEWRKEPDVPHVTPLPSSTRLLPVQFLIAFGQTFYIEASMNGMFGCAEGDNIQPPNMHRYFTLHTADIVIPYMPAWHLFWDYWVITDCARELGGWEERQALAVATEIVNTFRRGDRASIEACRKVAQKFLGKHVDSHKVRPSPPLPPAQGGV
jgi:alpha-mannosidase